MSFDSHKSAILDLTVESIITTAKHTLFSNDNNVLFMPLVFKTTHPDVYEPRIDRLGIYMWGIESNMFIGYSDSLKAGEYIWHLYNGDNWISPLSELIENKLLKTSVGIENPIYFVELMHQLSEVYKNAALVPEEELVNDKIVMTIKTFDEK